MTGGWLHTAPLHERCADTCCPRCDGSSCVPFHPQGLGDSAFKVTPFPWPCPSPRFASLRPAPLVSLPRPVQPPGVVSGDEPSSPRLPRLSLREPPCVLGRVQGCTGAVPESQLLHMRCSFFWFIPSRVSGPAEGRSPNLPNAFPVAAVTRHRRLSGFRQRSLVNRQPRGRRQGASVPPPVPACWALALVPPSEPVGPCGCLTPRPPPRRRWPLSLLCL